MARHFNKHKKINKHKRRLKNKVAMQLCKHKFKIAQAKKTCYQSLANATIR